MPMHLERDNLAQVGDLLDRVNSTIKPRKAFSNTFYSSISTLLGTVVS